MKLSIVSFCTVLAFSVDISAESISVNTHKFFKSKSNSISFSYELGTKAHEHQKEDITEITDVGVGIPKASTVNYFFLSDASGKVTIIHADTYDKFTSYNLPEIANSCIAVVNKTFYNIDIVNGTIFSTSLDDIMSASVQWTRIGSFPPETYGMRGNTAVNGSSIYFVTLSGNLYVFDTKLRITTKLGNLGITEAFNYPYASLVVIDNTLYIRFFSNLYYYNNKTLSYIYEPTARFRSAIFRMKNQVCLVGGNTTDVYPDPVSCYNPNSKTWTDVSYIQEHRRCPGIVSTGSKTVIFGGYAIFAGNSLLFWRNSVEVYNHDTNTWGYALTELTEGQKFIEAVSFSYTL